MYVQKFDLSQIDVFATDSFNKCYCHGTTSAGEFQEKRQVRIDYEYYLRAISSKLANFLAKDLLDVVREKSYTDNGARLARTLFEYGNMGGL